VKGLDQNSAVKEGEVELAKQTQSVLSRLGAKVEGVFTGKVISADVARDLANQVKELSNATITVAEKQENKLLARARANGVEEVFQRYLNDAKGLPTTAEVIRDKSEKALDWASNNEARYNQIKEYLKSQGMTSQQDVIDYINLEQGFKPVGSDTKPAAIKASSGSYVPVAVAAESIRAVKPQNSWGGQCGAFIHSIVEDYPYGLNGINEKESIINVARGETPQVGDVVIQRFGKGNKYGHVAVVNSVDPRTGQITLTESNYYDKTKPETVTHTRKLALTDGSISGYFRGSLKDKILS